MLHFEALDNLHKHIKYLKKQIHNDNFFLVWGCIRDLLLGTDTQPKDIDLTLKGDPSDIYNNIDKNNISHFITEKYGTITIIPKENKAQNGDDVLQYEITPFRKEAGYDDRRHPTEIEWADSLVTDGLRREFTISCLYYFCDKPRLKKNKIDSQNLWDNTTLLPNLKDLGFTYLPKYNLWIVQNHEIVEAIFPKGIFAAKNLDPYKKLRLKHHKDLVDDDFQFGKTNKLIVDPYLGIQDLFGGKLKCVGIPDKRFNEDALRIIRALRFVNVINFKLANLPGDHVKYLDFDKETRKSIKKNFFLVKYIAKERIKTELDKVFKKWNAFGFVALLDEVNLLKMLFPALAKTKYVDQPVRYHPFDVYHHTLMTLFHVQQISNNYLVRYAMLYHDVGKVDQYYMYSLSLTREEINKLSGINHRETSSKIARNDFVALWFSNKEIEEIMRYIDRHHKPEEILSAKSANREKKLRKLLSEAGIVRLQNLFDVVLGDRLWHYNPVQAPEVEVIYMLKKQANELQKKEGQFTLKKLAINWNDVIKELGITPWKHVGELLQKAFDWTINNIGTRNFKDKIIKQLKTILKDQ